MTLAIWWIRRDLRLQDNPALLAAARSGLPVLPVFILDPTLLAPHAPARQAFLFGGLQDLGNALARLGARLILRRGQPLAELQKLAVETGGAAFFAEEDYSPYARRRDAEIARLLPLHLVTGASVQPPAAVHKPDGTPYTIFTPFSRAWKALPLSAPLHLRLDEISFSTDPALPSEPLPGLPTPPAFPPGEAEAERRLGVFLTGPVQTYAADRNRLDLEGTSLLSPYLRFGMLSPRRAVQGALQAASQADGEARRGAETFLSELIWREFYQSILYHFPHVLQGAFRPSMRNIQWREATDELRAWQEGRTGYPVVDAAMRQLISLGWMHNRARMITASFLVKDLLINWQAGERWFMRWLVDGDPAANNGGWQWAAGTGTDAAPYFRIFNPITHGQKFDPQGAYIRRWLPELAELPDQFVYTPWLIPAREASIIKFRPGTDYPLPLVDHSQARQRTLAAYAAARNSMNQEVL